jgi:hypothetical protein
LLDSAASVRRAAGFSAGVRSAAGRVCRRSGGATTKEQSHETDYRFGARGFGHRRRGARPFPGLRDPKADDDGAYVAKEAYPYGDDYAYRGYSTWRGLNDRQAELDRRIDMGVASGSLTRAEAARLRDEFRDLAYTEARYRRTGGGLSAWERDDLDRRFDRLSLRIGEERHDSQYRGYRYDRY